MRYFDVRQPRPIRDIGDSRDEINSKCLEDDLMSIVRPTIPSQLLKISIRDLISASEEKLSLAQPVLIRSAGSGPGPAATAL